MIHSRHIRGAIAFYDTHRMRLVDAFGIGVYKWELVPHIAQQTAGTGTDPRGYVTTVVEVGTGTSEAEASDEQGVAMELVTSIDENDGITLQLVGKKFQYSACDLYVGMKIALDDVTQSDLFFGLAVVNTNPLGGVTDGVYFEKLDAGAVLSAVTEKNSTETQSDTLATMVDDTAVVLESYFDGTSVTFFVDGAQKAQHTANIPDDITLTPTIQFLTGEGAAKRAKIHWARAIAIA